MNNSPFSATEWNRIALQQQGLLQPALSLPALIQQLGYVQIDSINVVERAHHHVLHSRLSSYQPAMLEQAIQQAEVFEYWAHAAAYLPMADYRFSLYRKQQLKQGEKHWHQPDTGLMQQVLARITAEGPLKAADFSDDSRSRGSWWDWKPAKKALEQLFMHGDVMVKYRDNFHKVYDLTERVLPAQVNCDVPDDTAFARYLISRFLQAHGFGSVAQIGYLRKNSKTLLQPVLEQMCELGETGSFTRQNKTYYFATNLSVPPPITNRVWLLNPFDNLLIQRDRIKQWFAFDYQIEVYVPTEKRRYGYYSLAVLWADNFAGRVDVKADRASKTLLLQRLTLEPAAYDSTGNVADDFLAAFEHAVAGYACFNGCERWKLVACNDRRLKQHYRRLQVVS